MNRTRLFAALLISVVLFAGCGENPGKLARVAGPASSTPRRQATPAVNLDDLTYEVFSGTLTPGSGGVMMNNMRTWKNGQFSLIVPSTSMPAEGPPINFTMSIPTKSSYDAHSELYGHIIIRLAPDGEQFLGPITIQGTWMPWEPRPFAGDTVWVYSGNDSIPAVITYYAPTDRYRVTFNVNHFSDWEVGPPPRRQGQ